jgi:hypothetical protein
MVVLFLGVQLWLALLGCASDLEIKMTLKRKRSWSEGEAARSRRSRSARTAEAARDEADGAIIKVGDRKSRTTAFWEYNREVDQFIQSYF